MITTWSIISGTWVADKENLWEIFVVFTPSVGVEHFLVDLNG
jgi:hypothetical protein